MTKSTTSTNQRLYINVVLQNYDDEYIDAYYRYTDVDGRRFMSADLSGAGSGPSRYFGDRGEIAPPSGRHWMYDQVGIDKVLSEEQNLLDKEWRSKSEKILG